MEKDEGMPSFLNGTEFRLVSSILLNILNSTVLIVAGLIASDSEKDPVTNELLWDLYSHMVANYTDTLKMFNVRFGWTKSDPGPDIVDDFIKNDLKAVIKHYVECDPKLESDTYKQFLSTVFLYLDYYKIPYILTNYIKGFTRSNLVLPEEGELTVH